MMTAVPDLAVRFSWPSPALFRFPPPDIPHTVLPPPQPLSVLRPFNIAPWLYSAALRPAVPLTIAAVYIATVQALNHYNRSRSKQPWAVSKTTMFATLVVWHNILLAVFSAWTFLGIAGTMGRAVAGPGLADTVDSLCRLHGPRGLGASVFFNETAGAWQSVRPAGVAASQRVWSHGLAYYGWIFYLSKFYEVLDTIIILAKGKVSSTLQTYHHAGAMLCMWAGIRYMAAPIWLFVCLNSFIHSLMYTYYTLTAFAVKVPVGVKVALTSMQITQFLVGSTYATLHLFIQYFVPAGAPELSWPPSSSPQPRRMLQPCIVTSGEAFAIWLNTLYLAPLTCLFVRFFVSNYFKRSNAAHKIQDTNAALADKTGWDAARHVGREIYNEPDSVQGGTATNKAQGARSRRRA